MLRLFFTFEIEKFRKYFKTRTLAKIITTLMFFGVFLFVGTGIYFFFTFGFYSINRESVPDSKMALALFLYEVFLLILAGVTMFSATVSGVFNLFKGEKNNWIISSPLYTFFPKMILIRSVMTSSLPFFVLFIPAALAFNKVYGLGVVSLASILLSVLFFLVTINSLTLSGLLLITKLYYQITKRIRGVTFSIGGLVSILVTGVIVTLAVLWTTFKSLDLVHVFKADIESDVLSVSNIASYFNMLPTHPFALELLSWQNNDQGTALINVLFLLAIAVCSLSLWWVLSPQFYPLWQKFQEGSGTFGSSKSGVAITSHKFTYRFTGSQTSVLFKKEMLINSRNYKGVFWFLFLFVIWLLQIGTNSVLGFNIAKHQPDLSLKIALLQSLQFIIAIYFISSFSLRFVFPSFSVEKKTEWILGSMSISFKKVFFGKYFFYSTFFILLGLVMGSINAIVIDVPVLYALYSMSLFILATICIVTLGLSFGAVFPSRESDDPEVVTTSMPGLFFTAISLLFGALCAGVLYMTLYYGYFPLLFVLISIIVIGIITLLRITPRLVKTF